MDISVNRFSETLRDDQSWLGSAHGTQATQTITLDAATFNVDGARSEGGALVSGLPLAVTGSSGDQDIYGLWTAGKDLAGFLITGVKAGDTGYVGGAILEHGRVIVDNLPVTVDEAGQATASGRIIFA